MINTQYNFNNEILIGKTTAPESTVAAAGKAEVTENEVKVNRDTFEYCKTDVDTQLQLGNPALIHINGKDVAINDNDQHWVTVIGKKDNDYVIIDPWDGKEKMLSDNSMYTDGGSIAHYVILSNEY